MLSRGLRGRCGRCGGRGVFRGWFRLAERCPKCGWRFERAEGFVLGAYTLNFGLAIVVITLTLFAWIFVQNANPDASAVPIVIVGLAGAVVLPLAFYPLSRSLWAAMELAMEPLTAEQLADAEAHAADSPPPPPSPVR